MYSSAAFTSLDKTLQAQTKCLIATVHYALCHYNDALAVIHEPPDFVESCKDFERTRARLLEGKTGNYPWTELRSRSLVPDTFFSDVADYLGPIAPSTVRKTVTVVRLITTRAGEILTVVRAKASDFVNLQTTHLTLGFDVMNEPPIFPDR